MVEISTNNERLDLKMIHAFLTESYWAKGRTLDDVKKTIDNCLCFGVYLKNEQIGFARVLTDYAVFAYLMDVFILPKYRGKGYAKDLMKVMLEYEDIKTCKWMLKTSDAHGLYEQFGFKIAEQPEIVMERI